LTRRNAQIDYAKAQTGLIETVVRTRTILVYERRARRSHWALQSPLRAGAQGLAHPFAPGHYMSVYSVLKVLHIFFVVSWFAGLFYLPRIFVNHAMAEDEASRERLGMMERKLYRFVTPIGVLAIACGLALWFTFPTLYAGGWLHAKTVLVAGLAGYHVYCGRLLRDFAAGRNRHSHVWYRVFNELPVLVLLAVLVLVVMRPF
jgi:putative membrane protein